MLRFTQIYSDLVSGSRRAAASAIRRETRMAGGVDHRGRKAHGGKQVGKKMETER